MPGCRGSSGEWQHHVRIPRLVLQQQRQPSGCAPGAPLWTRWQRACLRQPPQLHCHLPSQGPPLTSCLFPLYLFHLGSRLGCEGFVSLSLTSLVSFEDAQVIPWQVDCTYSNRTALHACMLADNVFGAAVVMCRCSLLQRLSTRSGVRFLLGIMLTCCA